MTEKATAPPPAAPSAPAPKKSPRSTAPAVMGLNIESGLNKHADRIVIYGTGGIGKSTLAAFLPAPLFLDAEDGTNFLNVTRSRVPNWETLRGNLAAIEEAPPKGIRTVVIDSATAVEEMAKEYVISTRPAESGRSVESIEDYGWGKGWQFVYDEYCGLLADLDRIIAKGMNVCLISHEVPTPAVNPSGEDFVRWEPHLYGGDKRGRGSIRDRVKQWADHMLFVGYDLFVERGKGKGSGTRTIYTQELPTHVAKSRSLQTQMPFDLSNINKPDSIWGQLQIS